MASEREGALPSRTRPPPKRIDAARLRRSALYYLERYSVPAAHLQRVLLRKVERSCRHHGQDPQAFRALVEEIVASCVASGLVDDRRFAEAKARSLRRKGRSARAVAAGLAAKGVARDLVDETLAKDPQGELEAARCSKAQAPRPVEPG